MLLLHFKELDSTSDYLRKHRNLTHGTIVWAEKQTRGKGKGMRTWQSDEKSICFSILLKLNKKKSSHLPADFISNLAPIITQQAAVAVCQTLDNLKISASIKWPNDILAHQHKLCGILVERLANTYVNNSKHLAPSAFIVGIGINAWQSKKELQRLSQSIYAHAKKDDQARENIRPPTSLQMEMERVEKLKQQATHLETSLPSLKKHSNKEIINKISQNLLKCFSQQINFFQKNLIPQTSVKKTNWQAYWQQHSQLIGKTIIFSEPLKDTRKKDIQSLETQLLAQNSSAKKEAKIIGISSKGQLILQNNDNIFNLPLEKLAYSTLKSH